MNDHHANIEDWNTNQVLLKKCLINILIKNRCCTANHRPIQGGHLILRRLNDSKLCSGSVHGLRGSGVGGVNIVP